MATVEPAVIVSNVDPLIGQTIGAYLVKSQLGEGGMAQVFLAEHQAIGRKMAVKVLKAEVAADGEWARRFAAEAQVVAALKHRNIVEVFDFGRLPDGRQFLMMEFIEGESLVDYIGKNAPMIPAVALGFADQILNALGEAHKKGIVHRDLKPGNVILVREHNNEPLLKVLDFGLARVSPMALQLEATAGAKTSLLAGTPAYVAPEQAMGEVVDGRADLYSLGVMLFEMLTGHLPFDSTDTRELVQMHVSTQAPSLESLRSELPSGLSELVASFLEKDRNARPANADVARQRVQRVLRELSQDRTTLRPNPLLSTQKLEEKTTLAPSADPSTDLSLHPAVRRSPLPRVLVAVGGLGLLLLAGWALWPTTPPPAPVTPPPEPPQVVAPSLVVPPAPPEVVDAGLAAVTSPPEELVQLPTVKAKVDAGPRKTNVVVVKAPTCQFDDGFRNYARQAVTELRELSHGGTKFDELEEGVGAALVDRDCKRVNKLLADMRRLAGVREDE
ncbi:MAG: serine/threonine-protein kinase [Myxococcota bacterium]